MGHLVYVDDSSDAQLVTFAGLAVSIERWREVLDALRGFRQDLMRTDGMFATKELHAWKFVSGRGRLGPRIVPKGRRIAIYREKLQLVGQMDALRCFCACFPKTYKLRAFERLVNRINRTMATLGQPRDFVLRRRERRPLHKAIEEDETL